MARLSFALINILCISPIIKGEIPNPIRISQCVKDRGTQWKIEAKNGTVATIAVKAIEANIP